MGLANANMLAFLSTWHIVVLLVIVLLLFGGKKLPELARGLGKGLRIFRDELHGFQRDMDAPPPAGPSTTDQGQAGKPVPPVDTSEKKV